MGAAIEPVEARLAVDIADLWQSRALVLTRKRPIGAAVLSMLAHAYDADALLTALKVNFPGFQSIRPPFICSAGKVAKDGTIVADVVDRQERVLKDRVIFRSLGHMQDALRRLADEMRLSDQDRLDFFDMAKKWVVADRRLDPTMDPRDPDAKRLVH